MKLEEILVSSLVGSESTGRGGLQASVSPAMRVKMSTADLGTLPSWAALPRADSWLVFGVKAVSAATDVSRTL